MILFGPAHARRRHLWNRQADTSWGNEVLEEARRLSCLEANRHLSDAQLIRLAYWGTPGDFIVPEKPE